MAEVYVFGNYTLNTRLYELRCAGEIIKLEPKVFDVLVCLIENRQRVIDSDDLMCSVNVAPFYIMRAREAVGDNAVAQHTIRTVRGRGYHFVAEVKEQVLSNTDGLAMSGKHPYSNLTSSPVATLDVVILRIQKGNLKIGSIYDKGVLPVRTGDKVRVEITLSKTAFPYLVWITSSGEVMPVYPWKLNNWEPRPSTERSLDSLSLPEGDSNVGWRIIGPSGLETVLLMVRDKPLPSTFNLTRTLSDLPIEGMPNHHDTCILFESQKSEFSGLQFRGVDFSDPSAAGGCSLELHSVILKRLSPTFEIIRGVSFANLE